MNTCSFQFINYQLINYQIINSVINLDFVVKGDTRLIITMAHSNKLTSKVKIVDKIKIISRIS